MLHPPPGLVRRFAQSRLLSGVGANAYGQAVSLLIQFASVPLLLYAWGSETFGLWLVVSAIPSYLALADFGFSTAAANDMTLATARGAHGEAREAFQSVLALNVLVSLGLVAIVLIVVWLIPNQFLPQTPLIGGREVRFVWILQTVQVAATLCCGAFAGGFQSSGRYALGVYLASNARLLENIALVGGALLFHGLMAAAALMLAVRLASLAGIAAILLQAAPWLSLGFRHANRADIRRLAGPALAVSALPAAFAVSLQGFVLVVGAALSLDAVATFSTVRTLTRVVIQAGGVVNHAIMPEVTRAFGARDFVRIRRLIRVNLISVVGLNAVAFLAVSMLGAWIVAVWTRGRITPAPELVIGLAAVASLHSFWLSQANLILSINRHVSYSYWFLLVSVASVVAAVPAALAFGLEGVLLPLLVAEIVMGVIVARTFRFTFGSEQTDLAGAEITAERA